MAEWRTVFDADETLWHTDRAFRLTEARFAAMLADHASGDHLSERLLDAQRRNLSVYGYGVKAFVLSMIETAVEVTGGRVPGDVIAELLSQGREMLSHPIELMPHAAEAVAAAKAHGAVWLLTKGDLLDQERKLARSGLGDLFDAVHVVSDKTEGTFRRLFPDQPERVVMVGDSLRSDIHPALTAGCHAAHLARDEVWELERADPPPPSARFHALGSLADLAPLLDRICR